jgi:hypothetical protein
MSDNDFGHAAAGKALGHMLAINTVLTELDVSNCHMKAESATAFADGLGTNAALKTLNISNNCMGELSYRGKGKGSGKGKGAGKGKGKGGKGKSGKRGDVEQGQPLGIIALAEAIEKNNTLISLNLSRIDSSWETDVTGRQRLILATSPYILTKGL